jgi:L-fuconolactonase
VRSTNGPDVKIDAHQHFWTYDPGDYGWMNDAMAVLKRDYLPDELEKLARTVGLDGSVAVQARQVIEETEFLLELAGTQPFIKGVVGWLDLRSSRIDEQLARFSRDKKLKGVRHVVQDEPDDEFMIGKDFVHGIGRLEKYGLRYDILVFPKQLGSARKLVEKFPRQLFVLDHIAKPFIKTGLLEPWRKEMRELARHENVFCKLSGMLTEADWSAWQPADFAPYMDAVLEMYGPARLMFGSDWPVCTLAGRYEQVIGIVSDWAGKLSAFEQERLFGETAAEFYDLMAGPPIFLNPRKIPGRDR